MRQANSLIRNGEVIAVDGTRVRLEFESIHLHSRIVQAKAIAEELRRLIPDASSLTSEPFTVDNVEENEDFPVLAYSGY